MFQMTLPPFSCINSRKHRVLQRIQPVRISYRVASACGTTNASANFATRQLVWALKLVTRASTTPIAALALFVKWTGKTQWPGLLIVRVFHRYCQVRDAKKTLCATSSPIVGTRMLTLSKMILQHACRCIISPRAPLSAGILKTIPRIPLKKTISQTENSVERGWPSIAILMSRLAQKRRPLLRTIKFLLHPIRAIHPIRPKLAKSSLTHKNHHLLGTKSDREAMFLLFANARWKTQLWKVQVQDTVEVF